MRKVYVPNKSFHDFAPARQFGELIFLTEGIIHNRQNVNHLYRIVADGMADAKADDLILVSGMAILNAIAASLMTHKFGRVNYLIYAPDKGNNMAANYVIRHVSMEDANEVTP